MGSLLALLATGTFPPTRDEGTCGRCDLRSACGREPWKNGKALRTGGDPLLAPLLALEGIP